ncbi:glycosyltransferase [Luteibacter sp.]|uniref:glycosyltransferase n=1 Tax=Luteibacter sp. TaxID=1886636 RepID=UPI003F7D89EB
MFPTDTDSFKGAGGGESQPFPLWLVDRIRPSIIADVGEPLGGNYLAWCRAVQLLGLPTNVYSLDLGGAAPASAHEAAEHDLLYAGFSHVMQMPLLAALDVFPDGAIDLIILPGAGSDAWSTLLEAWQPKLSRQAVVMVRGPLTGPGSREAWDVIRDRYASTSGEDGQHRLLLVGRDAPSRIRDIFGTQDQGDAIASSLSAYAGQSGDKAVDDAGQQMEAVAMRLSEQSSELEQTRRALAEKEYLLKQVEDSRESYERKIKAMTRALENADITSQATLENLKEARAKVDELLGSRSWTITAPLRGVTIALRFTRDVVKGSLRAALSTPRRIAARGWRQTMRDAAQTVAHPRGALRRLRGDASGAGEKAVYKLLPPPAATSRLRQRVLIIAEMSLAQCLKYRVLQKQRMIQELGIDCSIVAWQDVASARDLLQTHTLAIFYRVPGFPPQLETIRMAKALGVPTYWEVDDLIFDADLYKTNSNLDDLHKKVREGIMRGVPLYREAMLACDGCIASTESLADVMRSAGVGTVHVIENALDEETIRIAEEINVTPKKPDGLVRIVYGSGSASHDTDFRQAAGAVLNILKARYDVRLTIIGSLNLPDEFKEVENQVERLPPSDYATYMKRLSRCHVNIAPLEPSIFNDAKSNIKYLEAAILKLPSVCSASAEFVRTISHGRTGFLATTPAEWEEYLTRLIEDPALRGTVGQQAHDHVAAHYTPESMARERVEPLLLTYRRFKKERLRVLGVNIFFEPRSFGGATIVAEQVARRINAGHHIDYAMLTSLPTSDVHPYKVVRYQSSAAEVFAMGLPFEGNPAFDFDNPYVTGAFREILRAWQPDVVHLHSIQGFGVQLAEVCQAEGIPFVVTAHDAWWICARQFMITREGKYCHQRKVDLNVCASCVVNPALNPYRQFRLHEVLSQADRLIVPSQFFKGLYVDNGFSAATTVVNKNGVVPPRTKASRSTPGQRPLRLGFVGGEGPAKGSELIKQVLREMPEHTNYELLVVDGALNLGRRVIFETTWDIPGTLRIVPAYTQETIDEFFEGVDVLLFPTQCKESFGLSVREAMIRDVWVIATDAGGAVEDIVPGENGDIVPLEDDGARFKEALRRLLENPERLDGYRNRHVDMIRVFDEQAAELTGLLQDVAKRHPVDHEGRNERRLAFELRGA